MNRNLVASLVVVSVLALLAALALIVQQQTLSDTEDDLDAARSTSTAQANTIAENATQAANLQADIDAQATRAAEAEKDAANLQTEINTLATQAAEADMQAATTQANLQATIDALQATAEVVPTPPPAPVMVPIPGGYDGGWFQVYFTEPVNTVEGSFSGAPMEEALITALDAAQVSIDAALFELDSPPVTDALIRAHGRGVTVRMVTDGENGLEAPDSTIPQLADAGIAVESDGTRGALMHNKFFVIDGLYVWTGSANITENGFYNNNNDAILIRSSKIAENYTAEFEELFAGEFGATSPDNVPNPSIVVDGTQIETIFEAEGDAPARLVELLDQAESVRFMAFSFTREDLMQTMIARANDGNLTVRGIIETVNTRFAAGLFCAGLDVRRDGNPDMFHFKVMIIDEAIVVTGSMSLSRSATDDNDENLLIIHSPDLARAYLEEFDRRWAEAETVPVSELNCE